MQGTSGVTLTPNGDERVRKIDGEIGNEIVKFAHALRELRAIGSCQVANILEINMTMFQVNSVLIYTFVL